MCVSTEWECDKERDLVICSQEHYPHRILENHRITALDIKQTSPCHRSLLSAYKYLEKHVGANGVDPDRIQRITGSDLGQHCHSSSSFRYISR